MKKYDCLIMGASFAGLSVASELAKWKVLVIDQKPLGVGLKSTCGTVYSLIKKMGLQETVNKIHKKIILHTEGGDLTYHLPEPFCVIDGEKFIKKLFKISRAQFLKARVIGRKGNMVFTEKEEFFSSIIVDASGPQVKNNHLSFGIETVVKYQSDNLHFWYLPKIFPFGIYWLFPQGATSRFGIGSYRGETDLKNKLEQFMKKFNLTVNSLHGGYFPHQLRDNIFENIFLVGDAAGQCLPLTGEGIRPAIYFGTRCANLINQVLEGRITKFDALKAYQSLVEKKRFFYQILDLTQEFLIRIPFFLFYPLAWFVSQKRVMNFILNKYIKILS